MTRAPFSTHPGQRFPPGARAGEGGVNFSVFSRSATSATLILYAGPDDREALQRIPLDAHINRTFFFWHIFVEGAVPGLYYTWQMDGPKNTAESGCRFDPQRELLDPWARAVSADLWERHAAVGSGATSIRARVVSEEDYDWEGDEPLNHPLEDSVIYELHVGGFSRHSSAAVSSPGTFRGLIEKIPYLRSLGVTDVQLLPVMAFDSQDVPAGAAARQLRNYWGYSPYGFFAVHPEYASGRDARREFRDMIKAFHRAGIGIILDVVFNHTAEGDDDGPTISFKGFGNEFFYHLNPEDRRQYRDFTGTGNTVNCNHPLVARFLLQCLEYWVTEMHVDGFRFDLASVLARGEDGEPMYHAPALWSIEFSDVLARSKLIAEAWDAGGLYQVGDFPGFRWAEWNARYRDTVRSFVRGDPGLVPELAARLTGSSDLYAESGRLPINSINYVTCHDGFTLNDLVSYERKHNEANGEENRDGLDENLSANYGVEGPANDAAIVRLRKQQAKNMITLLLLSQGVPMILAGDEILRTQQGNNNAYCQDNPVSWVDWSLVDRNTGMLRFTREMIALRKRHRSLRRTRFLTGNTGPGNDVADVTWYGHTLQAPDWNDPESRVVAFTLAGAEREEAELHVMINMHDDAFSLPIPMLDGRPWRLALDTSQESPEDILPPDSQPPVAERYNLNPRSVVVLEAHV